MTLADATVVEEIVRDGCYVSDFRLDPTDLRSLAARVDELSFVDLLDVGPGTGFGTATPRPEPPDAEHLDIVTDAVSETGLTTLLLPGVAGQREIDLVASHASAFDLVRVGVDADEPLAARPLLRDLADVNVATSLNLLKSNLVSPTALAEAARTGVENGAEAVYVVDSAGNFTPDEVERYVRALDEVDADVGYHGHDNIGFGLANAVTAIGAGATIVDASLQGIGRSAGNTQTELLCGQFHRDLSRRDWHRLAATEELVTGVYPGESGVTVEAVLYGLAGVHSCFEGELRALAHEHGTSLLDVLVSAVTHDLSTVEEIRAWYETR